MALAAALARSGERAGALGGARPPASGPRAASRVGEDLRELAADAPFPAPPREAAAAIIASDFYAPLELWRERLGPIAGKCHDGALVAVADPVEETYPFEGRVRFFRPGAEDANRIVGRAESVREDYLERFARRRADLSALAAGFGWRLVTHSTAEPARVALAQLAHGFTSRGAAA
jgi:uncharacterized protein (DUF58 family)